MKRLGGRADDIFSGLGIGLFRSDAPRCTFPIRRWLVTVSGNSVNLSLTSPVRETRTLGSVEVWLPEEGSPSTPRSRQSPANPCNFAIF
jgi:hypothetical protein